jgi:hypothetical protein
MALSSQWDVIANYESFELIKRDYEARHGRTPSTAHAREIAAPFTQARSYFRSAREAELTVKPLLLYYGVVSLSRGLSLNLTRGLREAALAPSHGLSVKGWPASLMGEKPDFENLVLVVTGGGTLPELARATRYHSLLRGGSSGVNITYAVPPIVTGASFTLGDLIAREPALQEHHLRWMNDTKCARFAVAPGTAGPAIIMLPKHGKEHVTRSLGDSIFAGTQFTFLSEDETQLSYTGPHQLSDLPGLTDRADHDFLGIGDLWLTALMPGEVKLSKITALFSMSYALGMLVRYFPTQWTGLVRGQIDDAALPSLSAAIEFIEQKFPAVVLDFLRERSEESQEAADAAASGPQHLHRINP